MYVCRDCGNKKRFIEHNLIETEVELYERMGEVKWTNDTYLGCIEVVCAECGASSEDGAILDSKSLEPLKIYGGEENESYSQQRKSRCSLSRFSGYPPHFPRG